VVNQAIDTGCKAIGVEDLHLDNMTRRCKAKRDNEGSSYLPNGQAAKSGLNRSLLGRSLGQIKTFDRISLPAPGLALYTGPPCRHQQRVPRVPP
jgi:putative transposase